jgi:glycerol-3-phosphate acyltransferase PlsX
VNPDPGTTASGATVPVIGVDAMGGDFGPPVVVPGVVMALHEFPGRFRVVLLGDEDEVRFELDRHKGRDLALEVVHAPERVEMDDAPAMAFRRKRNSSLVIATQMQKEKRIDALFSAGNTGAVVAISLLGLGRLERVSRPAIASIFPNKGKGCVVLDVGATADCKPFHLVQFAEMGACYAKDVLGLEEPRVGLLSIGEEASKGNELAQDTHKLLSVQPNLNFIGNVEGRDILKGGVDVVVTDGFTGNVVLKLAESVVGHVAQIFRREIGRDLRSKLGALLLQPAFERMRGAFDYAEYGGAPLLGVDGVIFIGHGRSSQRAIRSGILAATTFVERGVNRHIQELLRNVYAEA